MFRYNKNTGDIPKLDDRVQIINLEGSLLGLTGIIGGGLHDDSYIAIVILDEIFEEQRAVLMPVPCLEKMAL